MAASNGPPAEGVSVVELQEGGKDGCEGQSEDEQEPREGEEVGDLVGSEVGMLREGGPRREELLVVIKVK